MLRAVLANAPNSVPPERLFSILNNTFDDDQDRSLADYIELSLQLQFNGRSRKPSYRGIISGHKCSRVALCGTLAHFLARIKSI